MKTCFSNFGSVRLLVLLLFTFFFLYQPRLWTRELWEALTFVAVLWLGFNSGRYGSLLSGVFRKWRFKLFLILLTLAAAYAVLLMVLHKQPIRSGMDKDYLRILVGSVPCALVLALELKKANTGPHGAVYLVIVAALMQAGIVLASFVHSGVRDFMFQYNQTQFDSLGLNSLQLTSTLMPARH